VHLAIRKVAFYALPQALAFMRHLPIMMFLARDAGYLAFLLAAQAELADGLRPSLASMADCLGVSRTSSPMWRRIRMPSHKLPSPNFAQPRPLGDRTGCPT
jgi:hypothetical protein